MFVEQLAEWLLRVAETRGSHPVMGTKFEEGHHTDYPVLKYWLIISNVRLYKEKFKKIHFEAKLFDHKLDT